MLGNPIFQRFALLGTGLLLAACADRQAVPLEPQEARPAAHSAAPTSDGGSFGSWGSAVSVDPRGSRNVNTPALEGCPAESPNGSQLFFASTRAGGEGGIDIWVAHRRNRNRLWIELENLPAPVNSAFNDFCPTPLPGHRLLFVSTRPGGCGEGTADI